MGGVRHRAHDVEHSIGRESVGGIDRELRSLRVVATHLDQPPQRARLQRAHELRRAPAQRRRLGAAGGLQLVGDLQQVAHDDLIVGGAAWMLVDGFGDHRRLGGRRRSTVGGH